MTNVDQGTRQAAFRLIDANANRAAEGLRTIEDYARLVCEDDVAAAWIKQLRHGLTNALASLDRRHRLAARSAETDAGTGHTTAAELSRKHLSAMVAAAAERVGQGLRTLEEATKFVAPEASQAVKRLRYEAYDVLAKVELRLSKTNLEESDQLYLLIDCSLPLEQFGAYVQDLAKAGVHIFQLRDKRSEAAQLLAYASLALDALTESNAKLIVNDRIDIALACGADGVHLGQEDIELKHARRLVGSSMWIGISTHNLEQAIAAEQGGADYIGCGPTFPSQTKCFDNFAGPAFLQQATRQVQLPIFAIGGISQQNLDQVLETGCRRIAVSQAIHGADDPLAAARELHERLTQA